MRGDALVVPLESVLADPRYFPAQVDLGEDRLTFVRTEREQLAPLPFHDGRESFGRGGTLDVRLTEALSSRRPSVPRPDRFIFHVGFCGSTLLATLLDAPGQCFSEREPNVLVDLANAVRTHPPAQVRAALDLMRVLLARPWQQGEVTVCKPSNWANNLLPLLTTDPTATRPLFVTTTRRACLHAMFRGGRDRIAFVLRVTEHLLRHHRHGGQLWRQATEGQSDPFALGARIALVGLHVQLQLFEEAMARGGWGKTHLLTLADIEADPVDACHRAARALALPLTGAQLEQSVALRVGRHAKDPRHAYSPEQRREENALVEATYGAVIERALDWAALANLKSVARPAAAETVPSLLCA